MITDEEIKELLDPHLIVIRKWHDESLIKLTKIREIMDVETYKRVVSGIINNYVLEKAKSYFRAFPDIIVDDKFKSLIICFKITGVKGRFKKLNKYTLISSNNDTNRNKYFIQPSFFKEYPPVVSVEIGYVFNDVGTAFSKIIVTKIVDKYISIPLFEIEPIEIETPATITAVEIEINLDEEQQLKIKK